MSGRNDEFLTGTFSYKDQKEPATPLRRVHPSSFPRANTRDSMCLDSFGAQGACIKPKGHTDNEHRSSRGDGWHRETPQTFVQPKGVLRDQSAAAGGSAYAAHPDDIKRMKKQSVNHFTDVHRPYFSRN